MAFIKVAATPDLPAGKAIAVTVGNKKIALFNVKGQYYAIDDACTHAGGSLSEGAVDGTMVSCPWHGATFDLTTGEALTPPAFEKTGKYKVSVEGQDISLEI